MFGIGAPITILLIGTEDVDPMELFKAAPTGQKASITTVVLGVS